jgi:hypothetical protein
MRRFPKRPLAFPQMGRASTAFFESGTSQSGKKDFSRRKDGLFLKSRVRQWAIVKKIVGKGAALPRSL